MASGRPSSGTILDHIGRTPLVTLRSVGRDAPVPTMYRLLAEAGEAVERRAQRAARPHAVPRLCARQPDEVWTWDITALAGPAAGVVDYACVLLDLFSRYVVGWLVAGKQTAALATQLIAETVARRGADASALVLHQDRGAPMTSTSLAQLCAKLGVVQSVSRPRVSDDTPFSEAQLKTLKYQPDYPGRFAGEAHARLA